MACEPTPAFEVAGNGEFDRAELTQAQSDYFASRLGPPPALPVQTIPVSVEDSANPTAGRCEKQPWEYEVTVAIPVFNSSDRLPLILDLLRLQTVRPFVILVDTGSSPEHWAKIAALRAQDVEVFQVRLNAVQHSSEPVSIALDAAVARCCTRFLFYTHDDVFPRSASMLQYFRDLAAAHKVAGYQISPRHHVDWVRMVGHTALMIDHDWFLDHGLSWNMRRGMRLLGRNDCRIQSGETNHPDTETGLNYLLQLARVTPFLCGKEKNHARTRDAWIDHCRSAASLEIHGGRHAKQNRRWLKAAISEARARVQDWLADPLPLVEPLPAVKVKPRLKFPKFTAERPDG